MFFACSCNLYNIFSASIGVIIATAFGKITTSLVNDVLMPFIGWIAGSRDMTALNIVVREAVMDGETVVQEAITIGFGTLIGTIIDFRLVAMVVFAIVKAMNAALHGRGGGRNGFAQGSVETTREEIEAFFCK